MGAAGAPPGATSMARGDRTRASARGRMPTPGASERGEARKRSSPNATMRPCADRAAPRPVVDGLVSRARGHAERRSAAAMVMRRRDRARRIAPGAAPADDAADRLRNHLRGLAGNAPGRPRHLEPPLQARRKGGAERGLSGEHDGEEAGRRGLRPGQEHRRPGQDQATGPRQCLDRVGWWFTLALAADNPIRIAKLLETGPRPRPDSLPTVPSPATNHHQPSPTPKPAQPQTSERVPPRSQSQNRGRFQHPAMTTFREQPSDLSDLEAPGSAFLEHTHP